MMDLFDTGIFSFGSELLKEDTSLNVPPKRKNLNLPRQKRRNIPSR